MVDKNLCVWQEMYQNKGTTFEDYESWDESHPLYKCTLCDGYKLDCRGYVPHEKIFEFWEWIE